MKPESSTQIASFISQRREELGLTQLEVANLAEISRAAYSQLELGNRKLNLLELMKLSSILDFSLSDWFSQVFSMPNERAMPTFNFTKFKAVLLYILKQTESFSNVGRTVLYKLLYFSDFNYYEKNRTFLMGIRYSRLPKGPVPNIIPVLEQLKRNGDIDEVIIPFYNYDQYRMIANTEPDISVLNKEELEVIDSVLAELADKTATEISEYSHGDAPWLMTSDFEEIDYNLVNKRNNKYKYVV